MKKTYSNPTLKVVKIQSVRLLAGSVKSLTGADGMSMGDDWTDGTAGSRRSFSVWDEE